MFLDKICQENNKRYIIPWFPGKSWVNHGNQSDYGQIPDEMEEITDTSGFIIKITEKFTELF